jgi:hypothetical protein
MMTLEEITVEVDTAQNAESLTILTQHQPTAMVRKKMITCIS